MFGVLIVEAWNPTSLHPKSSKTRENDLLSCLRLSAKYVADHRQLWAQTTKTTKTGEQGAGNDWTAFCNQFRRSLLFEAKCQRMSMARCLWGLEKDYRLKFKSVTCVHYPVGCKSCKHLLCRLVYYAVSCTHYSVTVSYTHLTLPTNREV